MAHKKFTKEMILEVAKCKTDEEKKAFAEKMNVRLPDEALDKISGGEAVANDTWECEVCGVRLDSFWECFEHTFSHVGDLF